ncbi:hypothetical protein [Winogradskya humida]|uniref:Uncharacterized protein n=1 Tax=Winogradskya humida TaxID=113566 RepID=A0ABQ3ZJ53_9ACTN|nr:hypothetical protein [Actinoplanes humidus]GIE18537.1 hypothetical protein Ahu01nite_016390 [Actinoplanes humidus]
MISFPGSPWPAGHDIADLRWSARLEPATGLWFDLHLESAPYDADPAAIDGEDDWTAPIVWTNYHHCILSSTHWENPGFLAATAQRPLADLDFTVDVVEQEDDEDQAFGIYLLGHDSVSDHRITFTPNPGDTTFHLDWRGRIALRYSDSLATYDHEFIATADDISLSHITVPTDMDDDSARTVLAALIHPLPATTLHRATPR